MRQGSPCEGLMTDELDEELEALFDEIASEQGVYASADAAQESQAQSMEEEQAEAEMSEATEIAEEDLSEEDLEALFDELSVGALLAAAQLKPSDPRPETASVQAGAEVSPVEVAEATGTEAEAVTGIAEADDDTELSEEELESLFDTLSEETGAWEPDSYVPASDNAVEPEEVAAVVLEEVDLSGLPLYERVGFLVRQLHDSLRELGYDRALQDAATDVMDAKGRLEYVATLTEQAATRVLNSIDIAMPHQEELGQTAKNIEARWAALFNGDMDIELFKELARDSQKFASTTARRAAEEKNLLMEIMMAQDFQDITGQIIKKVVGITKKLEEELVQLLRDNAPEELMEKEVDLMSGPDVPTKALVQDDVDNLLARLGF